MLTATELRNGTVFNHEGKSWVVLNYSYTKTGRGSGTAKVKAKDLLTNAIVDRGFNLNQKFEEASVEKRSAQYLYSDDDFAYFMDNESFEQHMLPKDSVADSLKYIIETGKVVIVYLDEKPITIEIPKSVNLKVVYTEPAVKGDSSNNPMKNAELESGLTILVPLFVNTGDMIKVNTESGTYTERIN